jgi:hypothetical protein
MAADLRLLQDMRFPAPSRLLAAGVIVFFAISLPAQRYYGRDHHVYHPSTQTKHPASQATRSKVHPASTSAGHRAGSASSQSVLDHGPASNIKIDTINPPNPGDRQPQ